MKTIIKLLLVTTLMSLANCNQPKPSKNKVNDYLISTYLIYNFYDECLISYGQPNPLYFTHSAIFPSYNGAKVLWIADSTIDFSRGRTDFTTSLSDNRAVAGNTACDFLNQIRSASPGYETLIVASSDGNGVSRGVSSETSITTLTKVYDYGANVLKVKNIIAVGIHPIKSPEINARKNAVNAGIRKLAQERGYCYIDMVELFGKTDSQIADDSQMATTITGEVDTIHYNVKFYALLKTKIKTQCGIDI
jgi:hypothetical protein